MELQNESRKFQQYFCAFTVALGAVFAGMNVGWTSPCLKFLLNENYTEPAFVIKSEEANWIAALSPIGGIFGCIPAGFMADVQGRKSTLMQMATIQIFGSILLTFASNVVSLYIARFVLGLTTGASCVLIPMYITEIADKSIRGNLGSFFELLITVGILGIYLLGLFESYLILSYVTTAFMVIYLLSLFFVPESPIYLMSKNRRTDAEKILKKLRGPQYNIDGELKEIETELEDLGRQKISYEILTRKANIKGLFFAVFLLAFQQMSGDVVVIFFGEIIFEAAGASSPTLCTVVLGATQILGTFVSGIIVDRVGRKILLLISCAIMIISHTALGYYFLLQERNTQTSAIFQRLPLIALVTYILGYAIGFGPLAWVMQGELIGFEIKRFAFGIACVGCLSIQTFLVVFFRPLIELTSASTVFWLFTVVCILAAGFVTFLPETKNKSLLQIQHELAGKKFKNDVNETIPQA